jgi:ABC-type Fe3+-hydroxamate transport system substrate-binding protein
MKVYKDQLHRTVRLPATPKRIVSLVPSLTELLYTLELDEAVAGITKFCVHPEHWRRTKKRIGGTKQVHIEEVRALQPDLIIASKEENVEEQINTLATFAPVWVSDVKNMNEALQAIDSIGDMCNRKEAAQALIRNISAGFDLITPIRPSIPAVYLIWKDPYMVAGGGTYINDMLQRCGYFNIFLPYRRYPTTDLFELRNFGARTILLSTEPYPFKEEHRLELMELVPGVPIQLVDGEMFSWYGSRMLQAISYFCELTGSI